MEFSGISLNDLQTYIAKKDLTQNEQEQILSIFQDCDKYSEDGTEDNNHDGILNLYETVIMRNYLLTKCKDLWEKIYDVFAKSDLKITHTEQPDATYVKKPMIMNEIVGSLDKSIATNVSVTIPPATTKGEANAKKWLNNLSDKRVSGNLQKFEPYFQAASQKTGVPVSILKAIAARESTMGTANKHSVTGIKQQHMKKYITDEEVKNEGYKRNSLDPKSAILATARIIAEDYKKTGDLAKTLVGYNVGTHHNTYTNFSKINPGGYADTVIALSKYFA